MPDLPYRSLVWLTYRLGATFALGLPLALLIWSSVRRQPAITRLMSIYWKVASLLVITLLLLTDQRPLGFVTALLAPVLMTLSVWFWVDLNEELADSPLRDPLALTVRLWRWALSGRLGRRTWLGLQNSAADRRLEHWLGVLEQCSAEDPSALLFDYRFERFGLRALPYLLGIRR